MAAINLLLVLLSTTEAASLLIERAGLATMTTIDLLLILLSTRTSLLIERAGLATVVPSVTDLLLVLL
jgi:hypothetical protein